MGTIHESPLPRINFPDFPAHAWVIANDHVWLEGDALAQLARAARSPDCCLAVGMPDMHPGPQSPIGAVFGYRHTIHPALIGGDAGCGARLIITKESRCNIDKVQRRLEERTFDEWREEIDPEELLRRVWNDGIAGLANVTGMPERIAELARSDENRSAHHLGPSGPMPKWCGEEFAHQLGSVGGGNHFLEITKVAQIEDAARAESLAIAKGSIAVLAHTGSRALGKSFAQRWHHLHLVDPAQQANFMAELSGVVRYAAANRFLCAYEGLAAIGETRPSKMATLVDLCHNDVRLETCGLAPAWIHRKGAAPAHAEMPSLLLGSRGAASWLMWGMGSSMSAQSIAHGAGRKMTRNEAREKMKHKYKRVEMERTALGGRVLYRDKDLLFEEHPDAYKDVEPVVASLVQAGAAQRLASLHPLLTVKR
jgi:release factor H-coupled RctB family protein